MNHHELKLLEGAPLADESEEQRLFRLERAKRLLALARNNGPERLAGITLEQLAVMGPGMAVARLGLPSSVLLDEMRRLSPAP
jgi:hypothetical protein